MRGVELVDVEIYGEVQNVIVNGVDIAPLVEAELNRRMPERAKMRPDDSDGFREAWAILERLWDDTVARARTFPEAALHRSVDDEWSFIQTLRHLNFASAAWVGRMILGNLSPWHPLDLPWDEAPGWDGIPWDREARPSLDEVLTVRRERQAMVRDVMASLTDEQLATEVTRTEPGWPRHGELPVQGMSAHRPQRGMGAPAVRRARPDLTGYAGLPIRPLTVPAGRRARSMRLSPSSSRPGTARRPSSALSRRQSPLFRLADPGNREP